MRDTGKELWRTQLGDIKQGETMTMAPLVVKDKVLVGNSGGEFGVRGWLTALDAATGKIAGAPTARGPTSDVLIGADFKPFYARTAARTSASRPGRGEAWKIGGGTVWGWISYDPELDLIYYGTAQSRTVESASSGPATTSGRRASSRATPTPGEARLVLSVEPARPARLRRRQREHAGRPADRRRSTRKVLVHPDRNGYVYVMDRATRRGAVGDAVRARSPRRPASISRPAACATHPTRSREAGQTCARHLPGIAGRQGLAALRVVAAHAAALHPAPEPLPGRGGLRRRATSPARRTSAPTSR